PAAQRLVPPPGALVAAPPQRSARAARGHSEPPVTRRTRLRTNECRRTESGERPGPSTTETLGIRTRSAPRGETRSDSLNIHHRRVGGADACPPTGSRARR